MIKLEACDYAHLCTHILLLNLLLRVSDIHNVWNFYKSEFILINLLCLVKYLCLMIISESSICDFRCAFSILAKYFQLFNIMSKLIIWGEISKKFIGDISLILSFYHLIIIVSTCKIIFIWNKWKKNQLFFNLCVQRIFSRLKEIFNKLIIITQMGFETNM